VDFAAQKVTIGTGGVSKNRDTRTVDFNAKLGELLRDMAKRRAPDCTWLFPSPRRGPRDIHAKSFRECLKMSRRAAGLEWMAFHDLRHRFASLAVMAGLDYMTIAAWLGHKDGGMLVARVYGHLSDTHKAQAAAKLSL
jgi:integrase